MSNHIRQGQPKTYSGQVNIFVFKAEMYGGSGKAQHEEWDNEYLDIRITHNELGPLRSCCLWETFSSFLPQKVPVKLPISRAEQVLSMNS